jgi:ASCH domain
VKAITVQQPWSWCIAAGYKKVENRTWVTSYRGPLAIHAGKTADVRNLDLVKNMLVELGVVPTLEAPVPQPHLKAYGAVVAVVDLVGICTDSARCYCGPWAAIGQNHWKLDNVHALAEPVPARGAQGLWNINYRDPR